MLFVQDFCFILTMFNFMEMKFEGRKVVKYKISCNKRVEISFINLTTKSSEIKSFE